MTQCFRCTPLFLEKAYNTVCQHCTNLAVSLGPQPAQLCFPRHLPEQPLGSLSMHVTCSIAVQVCVLSHTGAFTECSCCQQHRRCPQQAPQQISTGVTGSGGLRQACLLRVPVLIPAAQAWGVFQQTLRAGGPTCGKQFQQSSTASGLVPAPGVV